MVSTTNSGRRVPSLIGISSGLSPTWNPVAQRLGERFDRDPSVDHRMSSGSARLNVTSMRFISCTASNECPPRSKKLSRTPIDRRCSRSSQILTRCSSTLSRGATIRRFAHGRSLAAGGGSACAVDLAVGRERQRRQKHECRRQHVVRQLRFEQGPQGGRQSARPRRFLRRRRRRAPAAPGESSRSIDERRAERRLAAQHRFDLSGLDAMPAQLHLLVESTEKLEVAVGPVPHEIARAVHRARRAAPQSMSATNRSLVSSGRFQ